MYILCKYGHCDAHFTALWTFIWSDLSASIALELLNYSVCCIRIILFLIVCFLFFCLFVYFCYFVCVCSFVCSNCLPLQRMIAKLLSYFLIPAVDDGQWLMNALWNGTINASISSVLRLDLRVLYSYLSNSACKTDFRCHVLQIRIFVRCHHILPFGITLVVFISCWSPDW